MPVIMSGDMEDCGFLPGRMKLLGEGGRPYLRTRHAPQRRAQHLQECWMGRYITR